VCQGSPSTCVVPPPGDECTTAEVLMDGSYGLATFSSSLSCEYVCERADRWFTISVAAGDMLELDLGTSGPMGSMTLYEQVTGTCSGMQWAQSGNVSSPSNRFYWHNSTGSARTMALVLYDPYQSQSSLGFSVAHETFVPHCGDGYIDYEGNYGTAESCDDNNDLAGDGCSPTCNWE
jgi:cysteine-rich repeat protein